jgi:hypothetical protein
MVSGRTQISRSGSRSPPYPACLLSPLQQAERPTAFRSAYRSSAPWMRTTRRSPLPSCSPGNRRIYTATDHEHETLNRQSWPIGNLFLTWKAMPPPTLPGWTATTFGTLMQRIQAHDATHQAQGPQVSMLTPCFSGSGRSVSMASSAARDRSTCSRVKDRCAWWEGPEAGDWSSGSAGDCDCGRGLESSLVISVIVSRSTHSLPIGGQSGLNI